MPPRVADTQEIAEMARRARVLVLETVAQAEGGHVGGPLSAADILAALYFGVMRIRPDEPDWPDRDRFVLSKGHSSLGLYTILALRGYFPVEELSTFDAVDSRFQGHPDMTVTPGVDMSSGSLGLGFAAALGMALGAKHQGRDFTTWVMLGDGECNEGVVWEGAHVASQYALDNMVAIVDHNRLPQYGRPGDHAGERASPYAAGQLADRWRAFGWEVFEVDGHDHREVVATLEGARAVVGSPTVIVAHTVKGKGVSFMENDYLWHSRVPTQEEFTEAMNQLSRGT